MILLKPKCFEGNRTRISTTLSLCQTSTFIVQFLCCRHIITASEHIHTFIYLLHIYIFEPMQTTKICISEIDRTTHLQCNRKFGFLFQNDWLWNQLKYITYLVWFSFSFVHSLNYWGFDIFCGATTEQSNNMNNCLWMNANSEELEQTSINNNLFLSKISIWTWKLFSKNVECHFHGNTLYIYNISQK